MNSKLISAVIIGVLFASVFTVFITIVKAEGLNLLCIQKYNMVVTLKNEADVDAVKNKILKIPKVKITDIKYRDKEWSRMVNKMDLPKMENPFKNEIYIKTNKNADINEIYNKIKEIDFVKDVDFASDKECKNLKN